VTGIDRGDGKVVGESESGPFTIGYDRLIIATGSRAILPEVPGRDMEGVYLLHTLDDGRALKGAFQDKEIEKAVIAGAGYIALEMTESLVSLGSHVTLTKRKPQLFPWMAGEIDQRLKRELERNGVELLTGSPIEGFESGPDRRLSVLAGGRRLPADLALVAVGVVPNSEIARDAGLELGPDGSIAVNELLETSDPAIYAAGDCADAFHVVTGDRVWIPLALRANRAGKTAGANAIGARQKVSPVAGTMVFRLFGLEVARSGLSEHEASESGFDPVTILINASTRAHAFPGAGKMSVELVADQNSGRLLGGQIVAEEGAAHRINTVAAALSASMSVSDFAGLDLAYAPPFGPTWDPMLVAASQLVKRVQSA